MATGPEHYRASEALLDLAEAEPEDSLLTSDYLAAAQAHATLANAAAMALQVTATRAPHETEAGADWREVLKPLGHGEAIAS